MISFTADDINKVKTRIEDGFWKEDPLTENIYKTFLLIHEKAQDEKAARDGLKKFVLQLMGLAPSSEKKENKPKTGRVRPLSASNAEIIYRLREMAKFCKGKITLMSKPPVVHNPPKDAETKFENADKKAYQEDTSENETDQDRKEESHFQDLANMPDTQEQLSKKPEIQIIPSVNEDVFAGPAVVAKSETHPIFVPNDLRPKDQSNWRSSKDLRTRFDFSFSCKEISYSVETLTNAVTGEKIYASTKDLGPENYQITWRALVNIITLVLGYAFPMRRLERLLGGTIFTASNFTRYIEMAASSLLPIYLHLFDEIAESEIIAGDDCVSHVWELPSYLEKQERGETTHASDSIFSKVEESLGFQFDYRRKNGKKQALYTTVMTGNQDKTNPLSMVVFYRTQLGSFGNLLEKALSLRKPKNNKVTIQSDLSSANLVRDCALLKIFEITYAGCMAHARRPFARYKEQAPDDCEFMLAAFEIISIAEILPEQFGCPRTANNLLHCRHKAASRPWVWALRGAIEMSKRWGPKSPLGKGARYLIKNYEKMTVYLENPWLEPTNNLRERLLRYEKLMDNSSFGRATLEGRVRYDILRSLMATSIAAKVDFGEYLLFILLSDRAEVESNPALFTPYAVSCLEMFSPFPMNKAAEKRWTTLQRARRILAVS